MFLFYLFLNIYVNYEESVLARICITEHKNVDILLINSKQFEEPAQIYTH